MTVGAVILAAGFGTRLAPLTDHTPKPLLEVGGQAVASWLVARLTAICDLTEIAVVVNAKHPEQWDRWRHGLPSEPALTMVVTGAETAETRNGAVADMRDGLRSLDQASTHDWTVVVAGDNLLDEPLQPHVPGGAT